MGLVIVSLYHTWKITKSSICLFAGPPAGAEVPLVVIIRRKLKVLSCLFYPRVARATSPFPELLS